MSDQIIIFIIEFVHGQAEIAVVKERQYRLRACYEHVAANVEFLFVYQQRIRNVFLYDSTKRLIDTEASLLTLFCKLELLLEHLRISDKINAFALV